MTERLDLTRFVPEDQRGTAIELEEELAPVVDRISQVLPVSKVWELFLSDPGAFVGKECFLIVE